MKVMWLWSFSLKILYCTYPFLALELNAGNGNCGSKSMGKGGTLCVSDISSWLECGCAFSAGTLHRCCFLCSSVPLNLCSNLCFLLPLPDSPLCDDSSSQTSPCSLHSLTFSLIQSLLQWLQHYDFSNCGTISTFISIFPFYYK